MYIVAIDDNKLHLKMARLILENLGHEVETLQNISELSQNLSTEKPADIYLIDYRLGDGVTGVDALKEIKKDKSAGSKVCIAFTADMSEAGKLKEKGFDDVLYKPITEAMLQEIIKKYNR